jgi:hypothetical protein
MEVLSLHQRCRLTLTGLPRLTHTERERDTMHRDPFWYLHIVCRYRSRPRQIRQTNCVTEKLL